MKGSGFVGFRDNSQEFFRWLTGADATLKPSVQVTGSIPAGSNIIGKTNDYAAPFGTVVTIPYSSLPGSTTSYLTFKGCLTSSAKRRGYVVTNGLNQNAGVINIIPILMGTTTVTNAQWLTAYNKPLQMSGMSAGTIANLNDVDMVADSLYVTIAITTAPTSGNFLIQCQEIL